MLTWAIVFFLISVVAGVAGDEIQRRKT